MKIFTRLFNICLLSAGLVLSSAQASLLWKISGQDLDQPSYLFGTIHLICQNEFYTDERIEQAFASTDALMLELDAESPNTMMQMQQLMFNPTGAYLGDHLNDEQLEKTDTFFTENFGVGLAQIGVLKPLALNSMVLMASMDCTDVVSYESYFTGLAHDSDAPIYELETVQFQMSIFDDIPVGEQVGWLWEMINDMDAVSEQFGELQAAYLNEDMDALLALMKEDPQFADHYEALLDQRNVNWVEPIREQIHQQSTFIAVGAGHLPGEMGVVELLREAGYTVEAVQR